MSDDHKHEPGCSHCEMIAAGMSEEDARAAADNTKRLIEKSGIAIMMIGEDTANGIPAFFYTVGFTDLELPEVIFFGIPPQYAVGALNQYFAEIKAGRQVPGSTILNEYFNLPVHVIEAEDEATRMFCFETYAYYEREGKGAVPTFVQWVFTDINGLAPWEEGYTAHFVQPILVSQDQAGSDEPEHVIH